MTDDRLRVLIADDHPLFRQGLRVLVDSADDLAVVGEAQNGTDAVAQTLRTRPDVVLMDLNMPGFGGVEATRRIVAAHPQTRVLILTMFEEDESVFAAIRAGARGYLLKGSGRDEVLRAVRTVAAGEAIFGPAIAERLTFYFSSAAGGAPRPFPELTAREHEVLELIARGDANSEIAAALDVSSKTVRNHVSNIFTKLRVTTRAHAIVKARASGMGTDPQAAS